MLVTTSADFGQSLSREELLVATALTDVRDDDSMWAIGTEACDLVSRLHATGCHVCVGSDCSNPSHAEPLATEAHARNSDPSTSHEAASSQRDKLRSDQMAVLAVAESIAGSWTYDKLVRRYQDQFILGWDTPSVARLSPSGIRSRAKELRDGGWIVKAGTGKADTGRAATLWRVNPERMEAVA